MYSVECYPDGGLREGRTSSWEWLGRVNNSSSLRITHSTYINNKKLSLLRCQVKLWDDGLKTDKRDVEQVSDDNFYSFGNGSHLKSFIEATEWIRECHWRHLDELIDLSIDIRSEEDECSSDSAGKRYFHTVDSCVQMSSSMHDSIN